MKPETRGQIRNKSHGGMWWYPNGNGNTYHNPEKNLPTLFTYSEWQDILARNGGPDSHLGQACEFVPVVKEKAQEALERKKKKAERPYENAIFTRLVSNEAFEQEYTDAEIRRAWSRYLYEAAKPIVLSRLIGEYVATDTRLLL